MSKITFSQSILHMNFWTSVHHGLYEIRKCYQKIFEKIVKRPIIISIKKLASLAFLNCFSFGLRMDSESRNNISNRCKSSHGFRFRSASSAYEGSDQCRIFLRFPDRRKAFHISFCIYTFLWYFPTDY